MAKKLKDSLNHPWDRAAATVLTRANGTWGEKEAIDVGVNFFVLALEALGAKPRFSCEGHPAGFYVAFEAPYELALEIAKAGYFTVEIASNNSYWNIPDYWSIRKANAERMEQPYTEEAKASTLRRAADAWLRAFGERLAGLECLKEPA
jgi:hypothetical protein